MKFTKANQFTFLCLVIFVVFSWGSTKGTEFPYLHHIRSTVSPKNQASAVQDLIKRLIPERASEFIIKVDPTIGPADKDTFQLETVKSQLQITGTSGVAAASGFHFFLKYYCGCHIAWSGTQLNVPKPLPKIDVAYNITSQDRFRYYLNVCTPSYSMVWWDWPRWEKEIDWMALNGINMPLAIGGQEKIWNKIYLQLELTPDELSQFFTGPAFLAWGRMGNIKGWGGPLPQEWLEDQAALQISILSRMRELGMTPVLPGFAGFVPSAITRLFPNASYTVLSSWSGFKPPYCCLYVLDPHDPLFVEIGSLFLKELINEYGTDHLYSVDTFNENRPKSSDPSYLADLGSQIYKTLTTIDPKAIWLMQGWLFEDTEFWKLPQAKAILTSVPQGAMIVLDLFSDVKPQYNRLESYFGQPFIWCMLHNFGGTLGLYGAMDQINSAVFKGRNFTNSTMIGTGLTMEGIFQNEVMYELMTEMGWRYQPVNLSQWLAAFSTRRYGIENSDVIQSWQILGKSVYNCPTHYADHGKYIVTSRPSLTLKEVIWYPMTNLTDAVLLFSKAARESKLVNSPLFIYDLLDVSREITVRVLGEMYNWSVSSYQRKDLSNLHQAIGNFTVLIDSLHVILESNSQFSFSNWIEIAKAKGSTAQLKKLYEYNARNQITLWGPNGEILDYATKQWDEIVSDYYKPRWTLFFQYLINSLETGKPFNQKTYNTEVFNTVEKPFTLKRNLPSSRIKENSVNVLSDFLYQHEATFSRIKHSNYFKSSLEKSVKYFSLSGKHQLQTKIISNDVME